MELGCDVHDRWRNSRYLRCEWVARQWCVHGVVVGLDSCWIPGVGLLNLLERDSHKLNVPGFSWSRRNRGFKRLFEAKSVCKRRTMKHVQSWPTTAQPLSGSCTPGLRAALQCPVLTLTKQATL